MTGPPNFRLETVETICIGTAVLNATTVVLPVEADKDSRSVVIIIIIIIIPALAVIDIIGGMVEVVEVVEVVEARCVMYHRNKRKYVLFGFFLSYFNFCCCCVF